MLYQRGGVGLVGKDKLAKAGRRQGSMGMALGFGDGMDLVEVE